MVMRPQKQLLSKSKKPSRQICRNSAARSYTQQTIPPPVSTLTPPDNRQASVRETLQAVRRFRLLLLHPPYRLQCPRRRLSRRLHPPLRAMSSSISAACPGITVSIPANGRRTKTAHGATSAACPTARSSASRRNCAPCWVSRHRSCPPRRLHHRYRPALRPPPRLHRPAQWASCSCCRK